jgi:adenylosuccinate synthase
MDQTTQSAIETEFVSPVSMEDAKARLDEVKYKKKDLSLQKKEIVEQQRQRRAEYTDSERKRATLGKGVGAAISKDLGKAARKGANVVDSYGRKSMAEDLEPLEEQRQQVEAELQALDREQLELEHWIAENKGAQQAKKPAAKAQEPAPKAATAAEPSAADQRIAQLKDLASLKEAGVLTEEEFQAEKKRILESS